MADHASFDNDVRVALYRYLVEHGGPPVAADIAADLGVRPAEIERSFRRLHDAHVIVLAPGTPYVWMANPFSGLPTPYRAQVGGSTFFGNCIWDAFGIVSMLGGSGRVMASCGDCGDVLHVDVYNRDEVERSDFIVHYAVPASQWWDDIGFN